MLPNYPTVGIDVDGLLRELEQRKIARRIRDSRAYERFVDLPGYAPDVTYRCKSMLCYAYSVRTNEFYVGYSGTAGGMARYDRPVDTDQSDRRAERIGFVTEHRSVIDGQRVEGCAEPCALSIAVSWGENPNDLILVAYHTSGRIENPCSNCQQWIGRNTRGYISADRALVLFR